MNRTMFSAGLLLVTILSNSIAQDIPQGIYKVREFKVNSSTSSYFEFPVVATNANSEIYVTWAGGGDIFYAKFTSSGSPLISEDQIRDAEEGGGSYPSICLNGDDKYLIAWMDDRNRDPWNPRHISELFGALFGPNAEILWEDELLSGAISRDSFDQDETTDIGHYIDFIEHFKIRLGPQGNFLLPWGDDDEVGDPCVDAEDQLCGFVDPTPSYNPLYEVMLIDANGFWEGEACYGSSIGKAISGWGDVAVDASGNLIFTYTESVVQGHNQDVLLQIFDQNLNPSGPTAFEVFNHSTKTGHMPNIAINHLDEYYIAYRISPDEDIQVKKFETREGNPTMLGSNIVNVVTKARKPGEDYNPLKNLEVLPNNYYVLTWDGEEDDFPGVTDVYARVYDSDDEPLGDAEFKVNDDIDFAKEPSVAAANNGNFIVAWAYDRGSTRDIFAAIFEFDLEPPGVTATTTFFPPAKIYNPTGPGYAIHSDVEDDAGGSGIESVYLVYEYQPPPIYSGLGETDSTLMTLSETWPHRFEAVLEPPEYPGTDVEYFVRARDKARNPERDPHFPDEYPLAINELGDINGNGCHQYTDLSLLEELIGEDPMAGPPENFFADLDQDEDIDCDDADALQDLIDAEGHHGCVARSAAQPGILEAAATYGAKGSTGIPLPIYLENDSSEVGSILYTMTYDPDVFRLDTLTLTQRTNGFSNAVPECRSALLPPGEEEVLLSGGQQAVVSQGSGAIANFGLTVLATAPDGKYHFSFKRFALADSSHDDVGTIALKGKFFVPAAPPVSIICTPISDTLLVRGDTLSFNTTLTNHHWQGVTASVYMYGVVEPEGGQEYLVVDTVHVYIPQGARISSITELVVPPYAPLTHYTFTGYVAEMQTVYDDDSFGFDVAAEEGMIGGGQQLAGASNLQPWPLVSGWFGDSRKAPTRDEEQDTEPSAIPRAFAVRQNYPNPFNPSTRIVYEIPDNGEGETKATVWIYDLRGKVVRVYEEGLRDPGIHSILWDGKDSNGVGLGSGIYFYRVRVGKLEEIRKMLMVR